MSNHKTYKVLGLMSGTSLDGLDIAYCHIWKKDNSWKFEIKEATTISYAEELKNSLKNAIHLSETEHAALHKSYGIWLGEQARKFIQEHNLPVAPLISEAICSQL